jgi:NADH:ubiquinone oxidoreductase subunit 3 (subunit A)
VYANLNFFDFELIKLFVLFIFSFFLAFLIIGLSYSFGIASPDVEKLSAYECGFDPYEDARNVFDVRFYLVAILFIIFDLEAAFLYPWAVSLSNITSFGFWSMFDFMFELCIGFVYVWKRGALEWE